jgi:hypothetical protein
MSPTRMATAPPLPPRGTRTERMCTYVSPGLKREIQESAETAGYSSVSDYIAAVMAREIQSLGFSEHGPKDMPLEDEDRGLSDEPTENYDPLPQRSLPDLPDLPEVALLREGDSVWPPDNKGSR